MTDQQKDSLKEEEKNEQVLEKPLELNEETIGKVKDAIAEEVRQDAGISDKDAEAFRKLCEEAEEPIEFLDKDFKLGPQELDIRKLTKKNLIQMFFRAQAKQIVWIKNCHNTMLDLVRLLFVLLDHLGVENIAQATEDVEAKLAEQTEVLKEFKKNNKQN